MDSAIEASLNRELLIFLKEELAAQGDGPDGLYQWYRNRFIPASIGLAPYDRAIVRFVLENCGSFDRFIEIGAGIGQECMLLALNRRRTWAVETGHINFAMMKRAVARVTERIDPDLPSYMTMIQDWYPRRASEYVTPNSILCFPTLSFGLTAEQESALFDSLRTAGAVILGLRTFFRLRDGEEEQRALVEQIRERGFDAPVDVHAWREPELTFQPDRIVFMRNTAMRNTAR